jgi:elongator complex protein 1
LPFLRELRALDHHEQRFRIDDHLGRRESALQNLVAAGEERFDDATSYLSRYELYDEAFRLYAGKEESLVVSLSSIWGARTYLQVVHDLYGDYLYDRREFYDAAICELNLYR